MQPVHRAEVVHDLPTRHADQVPLHLEQPGLDPVQEEINRLALAHPLLGGIAQRVDAKQIIIIRCADRRLQLGDHTRTPLPRLLQPAQTLVQRLLVELDFSSHQHLSPWWTHHLILWRMSSEPPSPPRTSSRCPIARIVPWQVCKDSLENGSRQVRVRRGKARSIRLKMDAE